MNGCPVHDEYDAIAATEEAVDEHVDDMRESGETVPPPMTERNYSGTFIVRTSRELHTRLVLEASGGSGSREWVSISG